MKPQLLAPMIEKKINFVKSLDAICNEAQRYNERLILFLNNYLVELAPWMSSIFFNYLPNVSYTHS